jgi:hypothetical protein
LPQEKNAPTKVKIKNEKYGTMPNFRLGIFLIIIFIVTILGVGHKSKFTFLKSAQNFRCSNTLHETFSRTKILTSQKGHFSNFFTKPIYD